MKVDFKDIAYLQHGNAKQRQAFLLLNTQQIMEKLAAYDPILVGTIPIEIDIENSDLDIICCFKDGSQFRQHLVELFGKEERFVIADIAVSTQPAIVASFFKGGFELEVFGQAVPASQQLAYRHMLVEAALLEQHGGAFRDEIISLKKQGHKTEPAFGIALGLTGDPYIRLLEYEK